jgi:hypothetical protein
MDFKALKPGKLYKTDEAGNLVEADVTPDNLQPVAEDDLPPDMRPSVKEAQQKIEDISDNLKKIADNLQQPGALPEPELVIPEQEKIKFLKAVVANKEYKKTFDLFGGNIKVTFKTLSTSELDAVSEAIVIQSGRVPYSSMMALAGAHMRFCLASSLCELEFHKDEGISLKGYLSVSEMYPSAPKKESFYVKDSAGNIQKKEALVYGSPGQKVIWAATDKFADINTMLYNVLFEKYQRFDAEVLQMTKETADPNFFLNGGGGPS